MTSKDQYNPTDLISLAEAKQLSGYNQDHLDLLCRTGKLSARKIGRSWVVSRGALLDFMEAKGIQPKIPVQPMVGTQELHASVSDVEPQQDSAPVVAESATVETAVVPAAQVPAVVALPVVPVPSLVDSAPVSFSLSRVLAGVVGVLAVVGVAVLLAVTFVGTEQGGVVVEDRTNTTNTTDRTYAEQGKNNDYDNDNDPAPVTSGSDAGQANDQDLSLRGRPCDRGNLETTDAQNADCHVAQDLAPRNDTKGKVLGDSTPVPLADSGTGHATVPLADSGTGHASGHTSSSWSSFPSSSSTYNSTTLQPTTAPLDFSSLGISEYQLNSIIAQQLTNLASIGLLGSGQGSSSSSPSYNSIPMPHRDSDRSVGAPLQPTTPSAAPVITYIQPAPAQNFNGASLLSATDLSSTRFTTTTANITDTATIKTLSVTENATVGGGLTVTGNITGNVIGTINPSFTLGSIPFQGASGLAQDNTGFFYDNTNNRLGLGTTTPTAVLDVRQATNGATSIYGKRATDIAPTGDFITYQSAAGSNLFRVDNSGNVTSSGSISGGAQTITSTTTPQLRVQYDSSNEWTSSTNSTGVTTFAFNGSAPKAIFIPQVNSTTAFQFQKADATPILNIDSTNGNVGIGTTAPAGTLDMYASTPRLVLSDAEEDDFSVLADGNELLFRNESTAQYLASFKADAINLFTNNTSRLYIGTGGNVGIGTTTPTSLLHVQGGLTTTGSVLTLGTSEDSVVANDVLGRLNFYAPLDEAGSDANLVAGSIVAQAEGAFSSTSNATSLLFQTGSSETATTKMVITSAGNVGIGTTSPSAPLHIVVNSLQSGLKLQRTAATAASYDLYIGSDGRLGVYDYAASQDRLRVDTNGQVTVGSQNQNAQLGVVNSNAAAPALKLRPAAAQSSDLFTVTNSAGTQVGVRIRNDGILSVGTETTDTVYNGSSGLANIVGPSGYWGVRTSTAYAFNVDVYNSGSPRAALTVLQSANVGIGTTSPTAKLEVLGSNSLGDPTIRISRVNGGATIAPYSKLELANQYVNSGDTVGGVEFVNNTAANTYGAIRSVSRSTYGAFTDADLQFYTLGSSSLAARMVVQGNGNVGIGTTAPGYKLAVAGEVNSAVTSTTGKFSLANGTQYISSDSASGAFAIQNGSGGGYSFSIVQNGATPFSINTSNYVGIGTTSALFNLHVNGSSASGVGSAVVNTNTAGYAYLALAQANDGSTPFYIQRNNSTASGALGVDIWNASNGYLRFATNNAEAMRITPVGNVGVGTTGPATKLQVSGAYVPSRGQVYVDGSDHGGVFVNAPTTGEVFIGLAKAGTLKWSLWSAASSNDVHIAEAGNPTPRLTVQAGGNVGIGTTAPTQKLEISDNTTNPRMLLSTTLTSDTYSGYQFNSGATFKGGLFRHVSNDDIQLWTAGDTNAPRINIQNGGRVKIGTTPDGVGSITSAKVEIQGNGAVENSLALFDTQAAAADAGASISLGGYSSGSTAGARYAIIAGAKENGTAANTSGYLKFSTNDNGGVNSVTERLRITSTGNVGVGTSSPGSKLHIYSNASTLLRVQGTAVDSYPAIDLQNDARTWTIYNDGSQGDKFAIYDATAGAYRMVIDTAGNVGIGTTNPGVAFEVAGRQSNFGIYPVTIGSAGTSYPMVGYNINYGVGGYTYRATGETVFGMHLGSSGDAISFKTALAGTAGNAVTLTEQLTIKNTGNIGITQSSPLAGLHILKSQSGKTTVGDARMIILENSHGGLGQLQEIGLGYKSAATYQPVVLGHKVTEVGTYTKGDFYIATRDVTTDTAPTERLYVTSAGNVGIGTTAPSKLLTVGGGTGNPVLGIDGGTGTAGGYITFMKGGSATSYVGTDSGINGANNGDLTLYSLANIRLHANNGSVSLFVQSSTGNVGIGNVSPVSLLDIGTGTPTTAANGLNFGTDTAANLYRSANGVIKTDGYFVSAQSIQAASTIGNGNNVSSGAGFYGTYAGAAANISQFQDGTTIASATTGTYSGLDIRPSTAAASFTLATLNGVFVGEGSKGSGSAVTTQHGINVGALTFGSAIYGIRSQVASGSNKYNLYLDGTAQNYIAGNVGIGTTAPAFKLDIQGADGTDALVVRRTGGTVTHRLGNSGGDGAIQLYDGSAVEKIRFNSNGTNFLNGGNVGIGTTSPAQKLDVAGNMRFSTASSNVTFWGDGSVYASGDGALSLIGGKGATSPATDLLLGSTNTRTDGSILQVRNNGTGLMTVKYDGNVGIGTTVPSELLHIRKDQASPTKIALQNTNASGQEVQLFAGDSAQWNFGQTNSDDKFKISYDPNGSLDVNTVFTATTTGNVGIGTTVPAGKLDVAGVGYFQDVSNAVPYALSIGASGSSYGVVGYNTKFTAGANTYTYGNTDFASALQFYAGGIRFLTAPSGTAGNTITYTQAMTLLQSGNVGIGTTTVSAKLHSVATTEQLRLGYDASNYTSFTTDSSGSVTISPTGDTIFIPTTKYIRPTSSGTLNLGYASDRITFANSTGITNFTGNVGIGTTAPDFPLMVYGALYGSGISANIAAIDTATAAAGVGGGINFGGKYTSGGSYTSFGFIQGYKENATDANFLGGLKFGTRTTGGGFTDAMRITNVGNVGIGTTTPATKLNIYDSSLGDIRVDGGTAARYTVANAGTVKLESGYGPTGYGFTHATGEYIAFATGLHVGQIGGNEIMTFTTGGNVGIGTTTPVAKLHVAGTARIDNTLTFTDSGGGAGSASITYTSPNLVISGYAGNTVNVDKLRVTGNFEYGVNFQYGDLTLTKAAGADTYIRSNAQDLRLQSASGYNIQLNPTSGNVGIGTTTPASLLAVSAATGAGGNSISLANTNVAHGMTTYIGATDRVLNMGSIGSTLGGAYIAGASADAGRTGMALAGVIGVTDPTDSVPALLLTGGKKNTTDAQALGAAETVLQVENGAPTLGTKLLTILGSGNVGIGTTAPTVKLDVIGGIRSSDSIFVDRTGGALTNYLSFNMRDAAEAGNFGNVFGNGAAEITAYQTAGLVVGTMSGGGVALATAGTSRLLVDTAGNVGIGTTTPANTLDIVGNSRVTSGSNYIHTNAATQPYIQLFYAGTIDARLYPTATTAIGAQSVAAGIGVYSNSSSTTTGLLASQVGANGGLLGVTNTGGNSQVHISAPNGYSSLISFREAGVADKGIIGFANGSNDLQFRVNGATTTANGTEAMRITSGGNVGIGTTTPGRKLEVYTTTDGDGIKLNDGTVNSRYGIDTGNAAHWIGTVSSHPFYITTGGASRIWIKADGNVGIGSLTPVSKLDIGSSDLGDGVAGPVITLGRNTNATNTGAGSINFQSKAGTAGYVWQDNAGNLRIHTAAPSNANDTAGVVVGDQTSTRETKTDIQDYTDIYAALNMVTSAPLHTFKYIKDVNGYGPNSPLAKNRIGFIADEVSGSFMWGNSIDQVSVNGILMASVKALNERMNEIASQSLAMTEQLLGVSSENNNSNITIITKQLYLSQDSVGQAKILAGSTSVRITFSTPYEQQPIVTATARGRVAGSYWVQDEDASGFTLYIENPQAGDVAFSYHVFASPEAKLTVSNGNLESIALVLPPAPPVNLPELEEVTNTPPEVITEPTPTPTPNDQTPVTQADPLPTEATTPSEDELNGGSL